MSAVAGRRLRLLASVASSLPQTWLLLRMSSWAVLLPLLKRAVPLPRLVGMMAPGSAGEDRSAERETRIVRIARGLYRSKAVGGRDNCLERSLLTYRYLAGAGAEPRLLVGMRKDGGDLQGHVWVTIDGKAVHDAPGALADFVPILTFRADGSEERSRERPGASS